MTFYLSKLFRRTVDEVRAQDLLTAILSNHAKGYVKMVYHYNNKFDERKIKPIIQELNDILIERKLDIRVFVHNGRIATATRYQVNLFKLECISKQSSVQIPIAKNKSGTWKRIKSTGNLVDSDL